MLTPAQAARAVNVSRQLVRDWYERGRLKRDEVTGRVRYEDVLNLERETRRCPKPGIFRRKPRLIEAV